MKKVLALLIALLIVSSPASANKPRTCGHLYDDWVEFRKPRGDNTEKVYRSTHYMGYIGGWVDNDRLINFPAGVGYKSIYHVVGKWLENHPEMWHERSKFCVYLALEEAYGLKD